MARALEASGAGAPEALRPSAAFLRRRRLFDRLVRLILFAAASLSVFVTAAIVYILISESVEFFRHVSLEHRTMARNCRACSSWATRFRWDTPSRCASSCRGRRRPRGQAAGRG